MLADPVRRYFEMWNTGDVTLADIVLSPAYVDHAHPEVAGIEAVKRAVVKIRTAVPDFQIAPREVLTDGDLVVVRATIRRQAKTSDVVWFARVRDRRMTDLWTYVPFAPPSRTEGE